VTVLTVDADRPDHSGEFALWVAAVVIVVVLHVGLAVAYLRLRPEPEARAEAPAFDVAFMPAERAPAAPPAVDQPDPAPTKMDQPEDPPKALPPPRKVTHDEKVEKRQAPPKSVAAPASKPMRVASAPNPGAESQGARLGLESWLTQFAAQIRRAASYPTGATGSGTAQVSVTVARNGRLVSRRLTGSAGSPALDQAALAAIDRAQPFPPFPASMPEAQISRTVPLHLRPH
jgi:protein TonB